MIFEVEIKVQHNCHYLEFSEHIPSYFHTYCNGYFDLLLFPGRITPDTIVNFNEHFPETVKSKVMVGDYNTNSYILSDCYYAGSHTGNYIQSNGGIIFSPSKYDKGWEYYSFICFSKEDLSTILKNFPEDYKVELVSVHDNPDIDFEKVFKFQGVLLTNLMTYLTSRQLDILLQAHAMGYYRIPRDIRTQDLAESLGITRYGFEQTLRKAENKIMDFILPMIQYEQTQESLPRLL